MFFSSKQFVSSDRPVVHNRTTDRSSKRPVVHNRTFDPLISRRYLQLPDTMTLSSGLQIVQSNLRMIQPSTRFIVLTRLGLAQPDDDTMNFRFNELDSDSLNALMNHPELAEVP